MSMTLQQVEDKYAGTYLRDRVTTGYGESLLKDILMLLAEMNQRDQEYYDWMRKQIRG